MKFLDRFSGKKRDLVGIDIGTSSVKLVNLTRSSRDNYLLDFCDQVELPRDSIVDGSILSKIPVSEAIEEIFKRHPVKVNKIATSVSGSSVIVKRISLPVLSEKELANSIRWEAEQYIPFDLSDVNLDYEVIGKSPDGNGLDIILVAAKKDKIADYANVISLAGRKPVLVDVDAFAIHNAFRFNYPSESNETTVLLNIGCSQMNVSIVKGTDFLYTRDIGLGGDSFTEALQKKLDSSYEEADILKRDPESWGENQPLIEASLEEVSSKLSMEIEKTIDFFRTTTESHEIGCIYLCGAACQTSGLQDHLAKDLSLPANILDPFRKIKLGDKMKTPSGLEKLGPEYAVSTGLAIRGF
jgi:type IV pilus assembly protein PilM